MTRGGIPTAEASTLQSIAACLSLLEIHEGAALAVTIPGELQLPEL